MRGLIRLGVALSWTAPADEHPGPVWILRRTDQAPTAPDAPTATLVYEGFDGSIHDLSAIRWDRVSLRHLGAGRSR